MKLSEFGINPISSNDLPENTSFEPVPAGKYIAIVDGVDLKRTKDQSGVYFKLSFKIAEGPYSGRKVFSNITYVNKSEKAEDIGRKDLRTLIACAGKNAIADTDDLLNARVELKLDIRQDEGYEPTNDVKAYAVPKSTAPQPSYQPASKQKPWG